MRLEDYDTRRRWTATVEANRPLTGPEAREDIRELELRLPAALEAEVGQSIGVILEGPFDAPTEVLPLGHRVHFRLYTIADLPEPDRLRVCVMRCGYVDDYSGEAWPGIASNRLCDARPGDAFTICGPYGLPWSLPEDDGADLVFIGAGTGVAPFRAFARRMLRDHGRWRGRIALLQFARREPDLVYTEELRELLVALTGEDGFDLGIATSPRPWTGEAPGLEAALAGARLDEVVRSAHGTVYVAGYSGLLERLDEALAACTADPAWAGTRAGLEAEGRWQTLVY
jgi:ferredoxin--NADP+ reductase